MLTCFHSFMVACKHDMPGVKVKQAKRVAQAATGQGGRNAALAQGRRRSLGPKAGDCGLGAKLVGRPSAKPLAVSAKGIVTRMGRDSQARCAKAHRARSAPADSPQLYCCLRTEVV